MYSRASSQQNQFLYDAHQAIMRSYRSTAFWALARRAWRPFTFLLISMPLSTHSDRSSPAVA